MDYEDLMPVGDCCVCGDMVDHSEMGNCETCGGVFHWSQCGSWENGKHTCEKCMEETES